MDHSHNLQLKSPISTPKPSHCKVTIATSEQHSPNSKRLKTKLNGNAQAKPEFEEMFKICHGPLPQVHIDQCWAKVRAGSGGRLLIMK